VNLGRYAKFYSALAGVAEIFIQTQWPTGKYTMAATAAIAASLVYLVPNARATELVSMNDATMGSAIPDADSPA
jgi:hypothetical protein